MTYVCEKNISSSLMWIKFVRTSNESTCSASIKLSRGFKKCLMLVDAFYAHTAINITSTVWKHRDAFVDFQPDKIQRSAKKGKMLANVKKQNTGNCGRKRWVSLFIIFNTVSLSSSNLSLLATIQNLSLIFELENVDAWASIHADK